MESTEYVVIKPYKKKGLSQQILNIRVGKKCNAVGNVICKGDVPLCYITSQDAYDYFSRNDDGKGIKRGKLVHSIMDTLARRDEEYQDRWEKIWNDGTLERFRRPEYKDYWLWNFDFYNAEIKDLEYISNLIKN